MPAARRRKSKGGGTRDDVTSEDTPPESKDSDTPDDSELTNERDANDDDDDDGGRRRRRRSARLLQLYAPRLPVMSSTFVVMLFALLAPLADRAYHKLHTEGRLASDVASVTHRVGRFHVKWDIHDLRLSVRAPVHPTDVVSPTRPTPNQGKPLTVFSAPVVESYLTSPPSPSPLSPQVLHTRAGGCEHDCEHVAWSTVPGLPFLTAANGPVRVHQLMAGHYRVDIRRRLQTTVQTLDSVELNTGDPDAQPSVVIRGVLIKEDARLDRWLGHWGDVRAAWNDLTHQRLRFKASSKLKARYTLTFAPQSDRRLAFEFRWEDEVPGVQRSPGGRRRNVKINQIFLRYAHTPDERIYGLGEQYSSLEHNGKKLPIIAAEQGIGRGKQPTTFMFNRMLFGSGGSWHTTYSAIPHYVTSKARSLFLTNFSYAEFDFTDDEKISILSTTPTNRLTGQIIGARTVPETVEAYTEYSGRMGPLPEWAYAGGVILGMTGGSERVRDVLAKLRAADVPLAGLWLQDWGGARNTSIGIERVWWNWELDRKHYPDWHELRKEAADQGTRLLTYVNPFLMDAHGSKGRLYREAKEFGYMVRTVQGGVYRLGSEPGVSFGLLDLTNPSAVSWIEDVIVRMVNETGASGWMADFGEYLPFDCVLHSGELPVAVHNRYPEDWAELNRRALRRAGLETVSFLFSYFRTGD